jgi:hypothetical protein
VLLKTDKKFPLQDVKVTAPGYLLESSAPIFKALPTGPLVAAVSQKAFRFTFF